MCRTPLPGGPINGQLSATATAKKEQTMTRLTGGEFDEVDVFAARIIASWLDATEGLQPALAIKYARQWAAEGKGRMLAAGYTEPETDAVCRIALAAFIDTVDPM
jgi:hypothetical protein